MAKETTETMTVQITFITNTELVPYNPDRYKKHLEDWIKRNLNADDVKITNLRQFEMDKEYLMGPTYELYMDDYAKANMFARKIYNYFPDLPGLHPSYTIPPERQWKYDNVPMMVITEGVTYKIYRREVTE